MFKSYRERGVPCLVIAGPYEFLADNPFEYGRHADGERKNSMPPAKDALMALAAHNLLRVDAGWLSPKAARWMTNAAGTIPRGYSVVADKPLTQIKNSPLGKIGLVLFPEGSAPGKSPAPAQELDALAAGRALAAECALVIGISPWSYVGERDFIPKAEGVFDCLFGAGEGVGFAFAVPEKNPGLLWLRADSKGRAVNTLEFLTRPDRNARPRWTENKSFDARLDFLDDEYPSDPDMLKIVGRPPE